MGPQVQPKCFRHVQHMRNNWELRKRGYLIRFGHTEALLLKKKKDIKRPFFPPCRNWPTWFQIADSTIPSGLGLIDCVQLFLDDWRQSTSLSSYQMPLKIIVGWILIDLFHLTLSLKILWYWSLSYLDLNLFQIWIFPLLVKIEFADF